MVPRKDCSVLSLWQRHKSRTCSHWSRKESCQRGKGSTCRCCPQTEALRRLEPTWSAGTLPTARWRPAWRSSRRCSSGGSPVRRTTTTRPTTSTTRLATLAATSRGRRGRRTAGGRSSGGTPSAGRRTLKSFAGSSSRPGTGTERAKVRTLSGTRPPLPRSSPRWTSASETAATAPQSRTLATAAAAATWRLGGWGRPRRSWAPRLVLRAGSTGSSWWLARRLRWRLLRQLRLAGSSTWRTGRGSSATAFLSGPLFLLHFSRKCEKETFHKKKKKKTTLSPTFYVHVYRRSADNSLIVMNSNALVVGVFFFNFIMGS